MVEIEKKSDGGAEGKAKQAWNGWNYKEETYDEILTWENDTQIEYKPGAKRPGSKSAVRYDKYAKAKTVVEALTLGSFALDLLHDYEAGFLRATGGPYREHQLDKATWEDLRSSGKLTEVDKAIRSFVSKGGRYPSTAPANKEKKDGARVRPKRAKPDKVEEQTQQPPVPQPEVEKPAKVLKSAGSAGLRSFFGAQKKEAEVEKPSAQPGTLRSLFPVAFKPEQGKHQAEVTTPSPSERKRHLDETPGEKKGTGLTFLARMAQASKEAGGGKEPEKKAKVEKAAAEELERCAGAGALVPGGEDDIADEQAEEEQDLAAWDPAHRKETALALWRELGDSRPFQELAPGERIPFTAVLKAFEQPGTSIDTVAKLLCPLFVNGSEEELSGVVDLLLVDHEKTTGTHAAHCVALAFGLNSDRVRATVTPRELPDTASTGRKQQSTLGLTRRTLAAAEVGMALAVYRDGDAFRYSPWNMCPVRILEKLAKVLGQTATGDEARQMTQILQGKRHFPRDVVLRALAHAAVLSKSPPVTCPDERAELIVQLEDAVSRCFAQCGGRIRALAGNLLQGALAEDLRKSCVPCCGVPILAMRAQEPKDINTAVENIGDSALLCEWIHYGERVQVHWGEGGKAVKVFGKKLVFKPEKQAANEEAQALLSGCLAVDSCILDVLLVREKKAENSEDYAYKREMDRTMLVMDMLSLNGQNMCQTDLRQRRAQLREVVKPNDRVRFPSSSELSPGATLADEVAAKLEEALGASNRARISPEASVRQDELLGLMRAQGVVLKRLDGEAAYYSAGRAHSGWQAVRQQSTYGAEADRLLLEQLSEEAKLHIPDKEEFLFTVVSGRRTGTKEGIRDILKIQKHYTDAGVAPRWFVDTDSLESYRKLGLDAHPGGKLIPSRNMALDEAFKLNKVCVQTSDDISLWEYFVTDGKKVKDLGEANARAKTAVRFEVSPVAAAQYLLANMRSRKECKLGGVYCLANSGRAMANDRFGDHQFIMGDFFVAEPSDIRFDTRLDLKEDYDYTAAHLDRYGNILRCNHLLIHAKHLTNAGGACSYRNAEREQRNISILKEKWGSAIRDNPLRENEVIMCWKLRKPA